MSRTPFWQSVVDFQAGKVDPWIALRNTLGLALPLAVGAALGQVSAGLALSTGALNVSFRDSAAPYAHVPERRALRIRYEITMPICIDRSLWSRLSIGMRRFRAATKRSGYLDEI
jgi:hypothetical protein